jgi:hypothetical protein
MSAVMSSGSDHHGGDDRDHHDHQHDRRGMIGSIATTAVVTIIGIFRGPTAVVDNCQISVEESRMFIRPL